jgi:hypothetical protein
VPPYWPVLPAARLVPPLLALAALVAVASATGATTPQSPSGERAEPPRPLPELPRGGRRIFPDFRVVAFYGAPQHRNLGVLGIGSPRRAAARLRRQATPYKRGGKPVLPAFELIATIALASPGRGGRYRARQPARVIRRYLRAARRIRALLILDIQPGRSSFMREARALRRWLRQPDVSLALDPEWSMGPRGVPGRRIGHTTAREVNRVSAYLDGIVRRYRLPQKLLVVHKFTNSMIRRQRFVRQRRRVAVTINVDGFGGRAIKIRKYRFFTRRPDGLWNGFKLFYEEDTRLLRPSQVLRLRPRPDLVVYE